LICSTDAKKFLETFEYIQDYYQFAAGAGVGNLSESEVGKKFSPIGEKSDKYKSKLKSITKEKYQYFVKEMEIIISDIELLKGIIIHPNALMSPHQVF